MMGTDGIASVETCDMRYVVLGRAVIVDTRGLVLAATIANVPPGGTSDI